MVHEINDVGLTLFYIYFPPTRMCYIYLTCPKNLACRLVLARPTDLGRELKENQKGPRIDTKVPPSSLLTGEAEMIALGRTATLGLFLSNEWRPLCATVVCCRCFANLCDSSQVCLENGLRLPYVLCHQVGFGGILGNTTADVL